MSYNYDLSTLKDNVLSLSSQIKLFRREDLPKLESMQNSIERLAMALEESNRIEREKLNNEKQANATLKRTNNGRFNF